MPYSKFYINQAFVWHMRLMHTSNQSTDLISAQLTVKNNTHSAAVCMPACAKDPFCETCNCFLSGSVEESFEASMEAMGCGSSCKNMSAPGTATHAASIVCLCGCELVKDWSRCYHRISISCHCPPPLCFCIQIYIHSVRSDTKDRKHHSCAHLDTQRFPPASHRRKHNVCMFIWRCLLRPLKRGSALPGLQRDEQNW